MSVDDVQQFVADRNSALLSLDANEILAFASKYSISLPNNPEAFWRGVHKARLEITTMPEEEKAKSLQWLRDRGSGPMFERQEGAP